MYIGFLFRRDSYAFLPAASNSRTISSSGAFVSRLTTMMKIRDTINAGSSSQISRIPPSGRIRYFQINTVAPPDMIPAIAPARLQRFQNKEQSTTAPNAPPKPAHAKETILNTLESGFLARKILTIAILHHPRYRNHSQNRHNRHSSPCQEYNN